MLPTATPSITEDGRYVDFDGKVYDVVFLDFETYYGKGYTLQSLTYPEYAFDERFKFHGVGLAINNEPEEWYTEEEVESVLREISWDDVILVVQNALFDVSLMLWKFGIFVRKVHDVKNFSRAIHPGQEADLGRMLKREFPDNPELWKGSNLADFKDCLDLNEIQQEVLGSYCKKDVKGTRLLWQKWVVLISYREIQIQNETLNLYLVPKFELDYDLVREALKEEKEEEKRLVKKTGLTKTLFSSNQQFAKYLEEELGLKVPLKISDRTQKPIPALGINDAEFVRFMAEHPEHEDIWAARKAVKSTGLKTRAVRLMQLADYFDGKVPIPLNYAGAHTLRWTGTQKVNPQNFKRKSKLRKALRAPDGYLVYVVDSSNIEARVIAWLANELAALDLFRKGIDTYNDMATKIYGYVVNRKLELGGIKPYEEEGNVGKTAKLGLGYGMGAAKFQYTLAAGPMGSEPIYKPIDFCQHAVNVFRDDNPNIVTYWRIMGKALYDMMLPGTHYYVGPILVEHERLVLPNGLALTYPDLQFREKDRAQLVGDEVIETKERNLYCTRKDKHVKLYGGIVSENVTQRASRDIVAEQTMEAVEFFQDVHTAFTPTSDPLALSVHDEGVFIMPDDRPDERLAELIRIFSTPPWWAPDLPLAAEGGYDEMYSK